MKSLKQNASDINTYIELILKGKHDEASKFINKALRKATKKAG